jgi:lipopolysaccharide export system protein LptA
MPELIAQPTSQAVCRLALIALALGLALFPNWARAQRIGPEKNLKFSDFYDPPHETQMKTLLECGTALPQAGGRTFLVTNAKLQTFRDTGEGEIVVEAPTCRYDTDKRSVSSPGMLRLRTADGSFELEGQGFLFRQSDSTLFVSNQVHTLVHLDLAQSKAADTNATATVRAVPRIDIFSDQFDYAEGTGKGIYRGNVRVVGTNLALSGDCLTVLVPRSDRRLQSLTAETNVIADFGNIRATGQQATYSLNTERVRFTGAPSWRVAPREGGGDELILDRTNGLFLVNGHAWLKMPGGGIDSLSALSQGAAPKTRLPTATNQFIEVQADAYRIQTNLVVFHDEVRIRETSDHRLLGQLGCRVLTLTIFGTNELQSMVAEDKVVVEQETNRLSCALLTLNFSPTNQLHQMIAENDVVIEQITNRFTAGKAVYTATNGLLELMQNPAWHAGLREGKGDLILVDVAKSEMTVQTNAYMRGPASEFGRPDTLGAGATPPTSAKTAVPGFAEIFAREYSLSPQGAVFSGGVRLDHPQMRWTCDRVTALTPPGQRRLSRLVAEQDVAFDLTDDKGQNVRGTGQKAVYSYGVTGSTTNELMELIGNPATLTTTNFTGLNEVFIMDLANHHLAAPGKSKYIVRNLPSIDRNKSLSLPQSPLPK